MSGFFQLSQIVFVMSMSMIKDEDKVLPGNTAKTFRQMVWIQTWSLLGREPNVVEYNCALYGFEMAAELWVTEKNNPAHKFRIGDDVIAHNDGFEFQCVIKDLLVDGYGIEDQDENYFEVGYDCVFDPDDVPEMNITRRF